MIYCYFGNFVVRCVSTNSRLDCFAFESQTRQTPSAADNGGHLKRASSRHSHASAAHPVTTHFPRDRSLSCIPTIFSRVSLIAPSRYLGLYIQQVVGEDWREDESQDVHFDDILSNIARDVASRAPPTPRQVCHALLYAVGGQRRFSKYDNREMVALCRVDCWIMPTANSIACTSSRQLDMHKFHCHTCILYFSSVNSLRIRSKCGRHLGHPGLQENKFHEPVGRASECGDKLRTSRCIFVVASYRTVIY